MKLVAGINERESDLEVLERLAGWFAHHLSHYDFKWNWAEWQGIVENNEDGSNCKRVFEIVNIQVTFTFVPRKDANRLTRIHVKNDAKSELGC